MRGFDRGSDSMRQSTQSSLLSDLVVETTEYWCTGGYSSSGRTPLFGTCENTLIYYVLLRQLSMDCGEHNGGGSRPTANHTRTLSQKLYSCLFLPHNTQKWNVVAAWFVEYSNAVYAADWGQVTLRDYCILYSCSSCLQKSASSAVPSVCLTRETHCSCDLACVSHKRLKETKPLQLLPLFALLQGHHD